jgi:eukaryotic-like serine/threonine-protein kinase
MTTVPKRARSASGTGVREVPSSRPEARGYHPGDVIAEKYSLIRPLREGGMGTVWVAHNIVLDVHVGIKLIELNEASSKHALAERLLEEARAAARLGHPAIVRVQDFGETLRGDPFLAMELLDGEDLGELMHREQHLDPTDAVRILLPIAHALATAHGKGIVHRDVKPENIFLSHEEVAVQPKLLDFGIARILDNPRKLTLEGSLLGTPDYMSPEQARGEQTDEKTDQWSFSVVMYEAMTGCCPFDGDNYNALLRAIIEHEPAPLSAYGVDDPELWSVLERALKKDSAERFGSMRDLGQALASWLEARGVTDDVTGTSLKQVWFRDPDSSGLAPLPLSNSGRYRVPSGVLPAPRVSMTSTPGRAELVSAPTVEASPKPSVPDLEAIAELNRGGDPLARLERHQRRRNLTLVLVLCVLVAGAMIAILFGTGIIAG